MRTKFGGIIVNGKVYVLKKGGCGDCAFNGKVKCTLRNNKLLHCPLSLFYCFVEAKGGKHNEN